MVFIMYILISFIEIYFSENEFTDFSCTIPWILTKVHSNLTINTIYIYFNHLPKFPPDFLHFPLPSPNVIHLLFLNFRDQPFQSFSPPFLDNIFYVMEYRELFLALFRKFDERYQPHSFLVDLVETTHLFLKMLERFCRSRGNLVVQVRGSVGM